jgi:hypothetical protein
MDSTSNLDVRKNKTVCGGQPLTHALPNWDIEGGFCNIGPLRRGLFFIFALQKSKKHLALLVSIRWTLFQTPT